MLNTPEKIAHDEWQIHKLAANYSHCVMRLDPVAAAQVYIEDGMLSAFGKPPIVGRDKIEKAFDMTFSPIEFIVQNCVAGIIEVTGDTARATWSVSEFLGRKEEEGMACCFGAYEDDLVRTAEGWRFSHRRFQPSYLGKIPSEGRRYAQQLVHNYAPWPFLGVQE
jgi:ketosteroid isomerase-like protein